MNMKVTIHVNNVKKKFNVNIYSVSDDENLLYMCRLYDLDTDISKPCFSATTLAYNVKEKEQDKIKYVILRNFIYDFLMYIKNLNNTTLNKKVE